jgi:HK97 family phage portal protein
VGLLSFLGLERRSGELTSTLENPQPWLFDALGRSGTGPTVNLDTTLGIPAFWTGCRIIRETIASLPFEAFYNKGDGIHPATNRPEYSLLTVEPSSDMSATTFRDIMAFNAETVGNAYARIRRDLSGFIESFEWIDPSRVEVWARWKNDTTREIFYKIRPLPGVPGSQTIELDHDEMIHLARMSGNGVTGRSIIDVCRDAFGMMLSTQTYGYEFYNNGAMPSGLFHTASNLTKDQKDQIIKDYKERYSGSKKSGSIIVTSNGAQYQHLSSTPSDAKWIETMQLSGQQIAQMMGIPQHLMGILERSTNNNIEQQSIDFVVHCIRPRIKQWEAEFNRKLWLTAANRNKFFTKFNLNALLRGDTAARGEYYNKMFNIGAMNRDEIRSLENMNPIPDSNGKEFYVPLNMHPVSQPYPIDKNQPNTTPQDGNKKAA